MLKKGARNTFYLFSSQILGKIVGFLWTVYLARTLGVKTFGQYQTVLAFVFTFFAFVDFGLNRLLIRDVSRKVEEAGDYLGSALGFRLILAFFAYMIAIIFAFLLGYPLSLIMLFAITFLLFFFQGFWFCFSAIFLALEKMEISALGSILQAIFTPLFGLLFLKLGFGLRGVLGGIVVSNLLVLFYFFLQARRKKIVFRLFLDRTRFLYFLKEGGKFAFLTFLSIFYLKNGVLILERLKGEKVAGLYSAGFKVVEIGIIFPNALATAFFPQVSKLILADKKRLTQLYFQLVLIAFLLAVPLTLIVGLYSEEILDFLFGKEFVFASPALSILGFSLILFFVNALPGNIIQSSEKLTSFLPWAFFNTFFNLLLNFLLVPRFSFLGPAYAILITETIGLLINNLFVREILKER